MIKKSIITLLLIALFLTSCGKRRDANTQLQACDYSAVINGIRWATRNVDAPGTFAEAPESPGMFFQWNRPTGWSSSSSMVEWNVVEWNGQGASGARWYATTDPCPTGWRMPTREELQSLGLEFSEWTTQNGVNGRLFGTYPYQIFLPAAGWRGSGTDVRGIGTNGIYWSSSRSGPREAWNLGFFHNTVHANNSDSRAFAFNVRCVSIN